MITCSSKSKAFKKFLLWTQYCADSIVDLKMFNVSILLRVLTIEVQRKADKISGDQYRIYMFMMCHTSQSIKAAAAKSLQSCPTLCNPIDGSPWDSPGKNTGVGCHFLLQCMKVKSESEVAQSCLTLSDLMDCSLPGSSVHGIFQARVLEWGAIAFSTIKARNIKGEETQQA